MLRQAGGRVAGGVHIEEFVPVEHAGLSGIVYGPVVGRCGLSALVYGW